MTGTKVLIDIFCLVCLIILFSIWCVTQWTALALGYVDVVTRSDFHTM